MICLCEGPPSWCRAAQSSKRLFEKREGPQGALHVWGAAGGTVYYYDTACKFFTGSCLEILTLFYCFAPLYNSVHSAKITAFDRVIARVAGKLAAFR